MPYTMMIQPPPQPPEVSTFNISIVRMRKQRLRQDTTHSGHAAKKWEKSDLNCVLSDHYSILSVFFDTRNIHLDTLEISSPHRPSFSSNVCSRTIPEKVSNALEDTDTYLILEFLNESYLRSQR